MKEQNKSSGYEECKKAIESLKKREIILNNQLKEIKEAKIKILHLLLNVD